MKRILIFVGQTWTDCPIQVYPSFESVIQAADTCLYSTSNFNPSCISAGCSQLNSSGLCPYLSNGSYDITAINHNLAIASECFQQLGTICDTVIDPILHPPLGFALINVLNPLPINATVTLLPDVCFVNNMSQTTFTAISTSADADLLVQINTPYYNYEGIVKFEFAFGGFIATLLQPNNYIVLPNIHGQANLSTNVVSKIVLNTETPTFDVQLVTLTPKFQFSNFNFSKSLQLLNIREMVENVLGYIGQRSDLPMATANFLSTFAMYAFQITSQNCPQTNPNDE